MIHKTAIIENGAKIGRDVKIGAYSFISKDAVIGDNCEIFQGAQIGGNTILGNNVKIAQYALVGFAPQDLSYVDEKISVHIGENTTIREFATINGGTKKGDGITRVGKNTFVMAYVHIAHDCIVGDNVVLANNATLAGHVEIGDFSVIGGLTPIHQFVKIGQYCMIAGASAISQDIPPFCLAEGNRAVVRSLNLVGIRRHLSKDDIIAIQDAYRKIFRSTKAIKESANLLLETTNNEKVKMMCEFIMNTKRGVPFERVGNNG